MIRSVFLVTAATLYTLLLGPLVILLSFADPSGKLAFIPARFWAWLLLQTTGVKVVVKGMEKLNVRNPYIFMSNHQSHFDILALTRIPVQLRWVAKKELIKIPVFGWAVRASGHIFIDRSNRDKAFKSIEGAAERINKGISVVIFPEGTRSPDGHLQEFKKGGFVLAIKSRVPIVPVFIRGSREVLPKKSFQFRSGTITITIGDPIPTDSFTLDNKDQLIQAVRTSIQNQIDATANLSPTEEPSTCPRPNRQAPTSP